MMRVVKTVVGVAAVAAVVAAHVIDNAMGIPMRQGNTRMSIPIQRTSSRTIVRLTQRATITPKTPLLNTVVVNDLRIGVAP
jgi:hypothetical protein